MLPYKETKFKMGRRTFLTLLIYFLSLVALTHIRGLAADEVKILNIGVLIEDSFEYRTYFNFAFNQTNTDIRSNAMPFYFRPLFRVVRDINQILAAVCDLVEFRDTESSPGIIAIFAPRNELFASITQSFGDNYVIPVIHYGPNSGSNFDPNSLSINLYPHFSSVKYLLRDLVNLYNWTSFAILYENEHSFRSLESVLRHSDDLNETVVAWKAANVDGDSTKLLKEFRTSNIGNVLVDSSSLDLRPLLRKLQKLQMLSYHYQYVFNNFHTNDYDLDDFLEGDLNFTSFQLMDYDSSLYQKLSSEFRWRVYNTMFKKHVRNYNSNKPITFEFALILDSMRLLQLSLSNMLDVTQFQPDSMSCSSSYYWRQGHTFANYIRMTSASVTGLTGLLRVNGYGQRDKLTVKILQRRNNQVQIVGNWTERSGPNITKWDNRDKLTLMLTNRTLRVTTIIQPPFTMLRDSEVQLVGNDRYEGYVVDLLEEMRRAMSADRINFQYQINLVKDGNYGKKLSDGTWNGMVGELQRGEADLAVAPLTINYERQEDIDFSTPYMNLGISILFRRQTSSTPNVFSFLMPLHMDIWMYLIVAYLFISTVLFLLSRFSPFERNTGEDPLVPKLSLANSFWFSAGAMMQQGSEIIPIALSTRVISVGWYMFTLIIFCSYTANLAAFLTVTRMDSPISRAEDLTEQSRIKYGTLVSSSTYTYFKNSPVSTYYRMFQFMETNKAASYVDTTAEGIERVEKEDYAFLMESTMLEYEISQRCNLTQIGGLLNSKFYGIGLRKGSPYTSFVSKAILQLQDEGVLVKLKKKWWQERSRCTDDSQGGEDPSALQMDSIGGIFFVLIGGTAIGILVALVEFCWKIRERYKENDTSFYYEMKLFFGKAYRKDEMIFGSLGSLDDEKDSNDDEISPRDQNDAIPTSSSGPEGGLSLYTNDKYTASLNQQKPTPQLFHSNNQGANPKVQYNSLPLNTKHSVNDCSLTRNNSANSSLKGSHTLDSRGSNSAAPRSALKLRFSPTVEKQIYHLEHASDQPGTKKNSVALRGIEDQNTLDAGTQTKTVRIKTDTEV